MTFDIVIRVIIIIIIAAILVWGAISYIVDKQEEKENYVNSCNGGLTDEEIKEMTKEDK